MLRWLAQFLVEVLDVSSLGEGLVGQSVAYHHGCHALHELGTDGAELAEQLDTARGVFLPTPG